MYREKFTKNANGRRKEGESEIEVCCPLCKRTLPDEDTFIDHLGQGLCPKDQQTSINQGASKAEDDHPKTMSRSLGSVSGSSVSSPSRGGPVPRSRGEPTLNTSEPDRSNGGPGLSSSKQVPMSGLQATSNSVQAWSSSDLRSSIDGPASNSVQPAPRRFQPASNIGGPLSSSFEAVPNSSDPDTSSRISDPSSAESHANSRRRGVTHFKFNKFSHRKKTKLENMECSLSKKMVRQKRRIKSKTYII